MCTLEMDVLGKRTLGRMNESSRDILKATVDRGGRVQCQIAYITLRISLSGNLPQHVSWIIMP